MPTMPPYEPPMDFKAIQAQREQSMARQMALTKGGGTFEVQQTSNPDSNQNIVKTAELMTRMEKVNNAQSKGGSRRRHQKRKRRKSRRSRKGRIFSARKYI